MAMTDKERLDALIARRKQYHAQVRKQERSSATSQQWANRIAQRTGSEELTKEDMLLFNRCLAHFKESEEYAALVRTLHNTYKISSGNYHNIIYRIFSEGFFAWRQFVFDNPSLPNTDTDFYHRFKTQ